MAYMIQPPTSTLTYFLPLFRLPHRTQPHWPACWPSDSSSILSLRVQGLCTRCVPCLTGSSPGAWVFDRVSLWFLHKWHLFKKAIWSLSWHALFPSPFPALFFSSTWLSLTPWHVISLCMVCEAGTSLSLLYLHLDQCLKPSRCQQIFLKWMNELSKRLCLPFVNLVY